MKSPLIKLYDVWLLWSTYSGTFGFGSTPFSSVQFSSFCSARFGNDSNAIKIALPHRESRNRLKAEDRAGPVWGRSGLHCGPVLALRSSNGLGPIDAPMMMMMMMANSFVSFYTFVWLVTLLCRSMHSFLLWSPLGFSLPGIRNWLALVVGPLSWAIRNRQSSTSWALSSSGLQL